MSNILNIQKCLKIKGNDALSFVDSLISNNLDNEKLKPSYLLRPDGKINHWFFTHVKNKEIIIYQESNELEKILDSLMQYAIRVECDFLIEKVNKSPSNFHLALRILQLKVFTSVFDLLNDLKSL